MSDIALSERHWLSSNACCPQLRPTSPPLCPSIHSLLKVVFVALVIFTPNTIFTAVSGGSSQDQPISSFNSSVLSASIKIVRDIRLHHHRTGGGGGDGGVGGDANTSALSSVQKYEGHIYRCLSKITAHMEQCVQQFNESFEEHYGWSSSSDAASESQSEEKVRRYCCMQNDFKDCWTRGIRQGCSTEEARPSKWLPLQMLTDLRTDDRCKSYVLYPHKCRENIFSLWQILAFLLLMPFIAFSAILFTIVGCNPEVYNTYRSLNALRAGRELEV